MSRSKTPKPTLYFHGGAAGLLPGDMIVPANELPDDPATYRFGDYPASRSRVYVTTSRLMGQQFASVWCTRVEGRVLRGTLYQVTPLGGLEEDNDFVGHPEFRTCERARIDKVLKTNVQPDRAAEIAVAQFMTWDDGLPMYDAYGCALPPQVALDAGVTAKDLRPLGTMPDFRTINAKIIDIADQRGLNIPRRMSTFGQR